MGRPRKILVADLLCGAGGSSTGAARALIQLGLEMELVCVNHWPVAIETHSKNHPQARHHCLDIATVRPHILVPEGYLDLLMASPTCTHHSVARGGKPTSDQQRSDPWHIITWLTELRVKRMIIENVWEFCGWGPVDARTGKPVKSRKGEYFYAWIETIRRLGFEPEWRKLNAANYGDATTRARFILKARNDRRIVAWAPLTHAKRADDLLLFPTVKPWRPAREIIDWNIKGRSIFGRKKPLAAKTLARIHAGAVKFGWPEPFLVILRNHMAGQSLDQPLPTIAANGGHIALAQPIVVTVAHGNDADEASPNNRRTSSIETPLGTIHAGGGKYAVVEPLVMAPGSYGAPRTSDEPLPTITTGGAGAGERVGCARPMLVEPFILNRHGEGYGAARAHSVEQPAPTANCDGGGYLVEPFVLSRHGEGAPRSVEQPTPTQVAKHSHCLITSYYGASKSCGSTDDPLPTVTSTDRFGVVVPVTHTKGGNSARDVADPLPTLTTAKGGEFAIVMPVTHHGGVDRSRDPDHEPLPTVTCANRGELAMIEASSSEGLPQYDILFRMLEPHELAAAMGFDDDEAKYEFAGTKTEKVKQIGNAVSVAMMKAEVTAIMADAAVKLMPEMPALLRAAE